MNEIKSLRFESVGFTYDEQTRVFEKISFELPTHSLIHVSGATGNGQSTLLRLLAVLLQPQEGRYLINGEDTTQMSFEEFLPLRKKIGYTFDYGGLFANRTLQDNLTLPLLYHKYCSHDEANALVQNFAREFSFERQLHQRPAAVSGGLRKLACVLRAFILRPEMVVMDDPFTGVDPESARKLIRLIETRRETGELKHVFLTSREEIWPQKLGCKTLLVDRNSLQMAGRESGLKVA